jgi:two-component system, NtrC family, sensor kinase
VDQDQNIVRRLERKLRRSEQHRAELEEIRDKDQALYKKMHSEIEAARATIEQNNRELERRNREILVQHSELQDALKELKAAQAQLVQSEKMASLGQLTAGIAHEIKNPLNFINNFSEIIVELAAELRGDISEKPDDQRPSDAEIDEALTEIETLAARILEQGRRTDSIVKGMLQHSRGATGQRESVDVNRLLDEYIKLGLHGIRTQQGGFDVEIIRDLAADLHEIEGKPQELGQVFVNLLNNAFYAVDARKKASADPSYSPTVTVSSRSVRECVEIRVADNGHGVPAELRKKIFEPFFTTKPAGSGTGLGLSLSYDIITQGHGGTMIVEDAPGGGAAFVITLPDKSV